MRATLFLAEGPSSPIGVVSRDSSRTLQQVISESSSTCWRSKGNIVMWPWETHTLRFQLDLIHVKIWY